MISGGSTARTYADYRGTEWHDLDRLLSAHLSYNIEQPEGKSTEFDHLGFGECVAFVLKIVDTIRDVWFEKKDRYKNTFVKFLWRRIRIGFVKPD